MALPLTREGILTIAPCTDSWLGVPVVVDRPDSHRLVASSVAEDDDAFAAALVVDRCQESLRQHVLFASLPDGRVLSFERFTALEALQLESLNQGFLRIVNEHFPMLAPNCRGERALFLSESSKDYKGWIGTEESEDVVDDLGQPEWLNVDDRMGIRFAGAGRAVYHNRHHFKPYRAIADDLTLSVQDSPRGLAAGEEAGHLAALLIPEQDHGETRDESFRHLDGPEATACLACTGFLAAANFAPGARTCSFTGPRPERIPAYAGASVTVDDGTFTVTMVLGKTSARLLRESLTLITDGDVRIDTASDGTVFVTNLGEATVSVQIDDGSGEGQSIDVSAGGTVRA